MQMLLIDPLLTPYQTVIGRDFARYRNHVCRVFLNCILFDNRPENQEKYAIAAVFHDIGIWTDHTFDYLHPSIARASDYLLANQKTDWMEEIILMIDMHHKWTPYRGLHADLVEVFRKADWIDVSLGTRTFGLDGKTIRAQHKTYPNLGFHSFLLRSTLKQLLKHPFRNPLPMFKA